MAFKHKLSRRLAQLKKALVMGVLAAVGCTADQAVNGPAAPTAPDGGPRAAVTAAAVPTFGHVFVITLENTDYASVIGNSSAPYLNGLANQYSLATQYYANTPPSIGNYFMLATGRTITNNDSYSTVRTDDNVVRRLLAAGKTWKSYAEDLPSVGYTGPDVGNYARKHNVFALLSDVANDATQRNNLVPFGQFAIDLANGTLPSFSNIVPNLCNDGHDCGLGTADTWLRNKLGPLLASSTFQQDGLLIITFDESGGDNSNGGGRVFWIAVGPKARLGYQSTTLYQHQSTLRLILSGLGVTSFPGAASNAPDMGEFFQTGTVTPPSPPPPPAPPAPPPPPPPPPGTCVTASASWLNSGFASQAGSFTAEFDATPSAANIDGVTGLAHGAVSDYTGLAAIVRFNGTGTIDARNGGAYTAASTISYSAGKAYHFRLVVATASRTYSAYVTPAGGAEQTIGVG